MLETGNRIFFLFKAHSCVWHKLLQSLKHESDEVTGPADMNIPEKLTQVEFCIVENDLNKILGSPNSLLFFSHPQATGYIYIHNDYLTITDT